MVWRLVKIMLPVWPLMTIAALAGWLTVAANIGLMAASALLICMAALHPSIGELSIAIVGVRFFGISRAVLRYCERYLSHDATFRLLSYIRVWFFSRLEPLAPARLQHWQSGQLFGAIVGDVETLRDFYLRALAPPVITIMVFVGMALFLQRFSSVLILLLAAAFLLAGVMMPLFVRWLNRGCAVHLVQARSELKAQLVDTVDGLTELAAFNCKGSQFKRIEIIDRQLSALQSRTAAINAIVESGGSLLMNGALWAVLYMTIPLVDSGQMEGIYLAVVALAVQSSFEAVLMLPASVHYLMESMAAARRLFQIVDDAPTIAMPMQPARLPADHTLIIDNLCFQYEACNQILKNLSFQLQPGKRMALVGPSGAGKSTIVNLLLRFWEYDSGSITLGGVDYRRLPPQDVRQLYNVVSQQTHIFHGTIRENILLARPTATQDELLAAVDGAQLTTFAANLPEGLDTVVGHNGQLLSGGQRQRIAIARALLKEAPFLVLDEPTVGLDAVTERQIMSTLHQLSQGRATLLITHRLSGLETMDEIMVLDGGRVAEQGRFDELIGRKGLFYQLITIGKGL